MNKKDLFLQLYDSIIQAQQLNLPRKLPCRTLVTKLRKNKLTTIVLKVMTELETSNKH